MGKRSEFERVSKDWYPTPFEAVEPLKNMLYEGFTFLEPCAGDGRLVKHLEAIGGICKGAYDIEPKAEGIIEADAFEIELPKVDFIITNPPWSRPILHPMIEKFSSHAPTWLLFDADWAHTKQAAPYLSKCAHIHGVGRVRWFPETGMSGKDNAAWYLFHNKEMITQFTTKWGN